MLPFVWSLPDWSSHFSYLELRPQSPIRTSLMVRPDHCPFFMQLLFWHARSLNYA
nr:MAG TPA: hypothetical protein [Caudoviricetes sp.]